MASIFYSFCTEYSEKNFAVTPLNGKAPVLNNWPNIDYDEDSEYQGMNIGLICGQRSGVVALDIDLKDPKEIKEVMAIVPPTPCAKIGAKGITLFYKYNGEQSEKIRRNNLPIVELLSNGNQTVLPPSIHPETKKPYYWQMISLLDIDMDDLPDLNWSIVSNQLRNLGNKTKSKKSYDNEPIPTDRCRHGSWDTLKSYACVLQKNKTPIDIAIQKLIEVDQSFNPVLPYFLDRSKQKTDDAYTNAVGFYAGIMSTVTRNRALRGECPETPKIIDTVEHDDNFKLVHFDKTCMPKNMWEFCRQSALASETHPDYLCASLLLAFTAVIGDQVKVFPSHKSSWFWRPKMSVCIVGNPSSRKSSAAAFGPNIVKKALAQITKENRQKIEKDRFELMAIELKLKKEQKEFDKAIESGNEYNTNTIIDLQQKAKSIKNNQQKNYILNNATIQGIQLVMSERPGAYIQQYDELTGWLEFVESKGQAGARGEFLELMNQGVENYQVTRKGQGLSLSIDRGHISLIGTLQTDMFDKFKEKRDGLIQRINIINPNYRIPMKRQEYTVDSWLSKGLLDFMVYCIEADVNEYSDNGNLYFSKKAETILIDIESSLREMASQSNIDLESYLNKAMTLVYNFSAVYHLAANFSEHRKDICISEQSVALAINALQIFISYAVPQYTKQEVDKEEIEDLSDKIWDRIIDKFINKEFTCRDLQRSMKMISPEDATKTLDKKVSQNLLKIVGQNRSGKSIYSLA
jgi:hypothetical protein